LERLKYQLESFFCNIRTS